MNSTSPRFCTYMPMVVALLWAGMAAPYAEESAINRFFTFREDQKPLVAPKYATVPRVVRQPYYPTEAHEAWSNFYTRSDLVPEDYLGSSASKVMRPNMATPYARSGWEAIAAQAKAQAAEQAAPTNDSSSFSAPEAPANIAIGDPGNGLGVQNSDAQLGRATEIGDAKQDWRGNSNGIPLTSRPGDFDYRAPVDVADAPRSRVAIDDAAPMARATDKDPFADLNAVAQPESLKKSPKFAAVNSDGEVTKYVVQKGDTLKAIAALDDVYGDWKLWPLIYSANRHAIGSKPTHLKAGMKLTIPRNYTQKQAKEARRKAGSR